MKIYMFRDPDGKNYAKPLAKAIDFIHEKEKELGSNELISAPISADKYDSKTNTLYQHVRVDVFDSKEEKQKHYTSNEREIDDEYIKWIEAIWAEDDRDFGKKRAQR